MGSPIPLVAMPPNVLREVELMRGEGRVGRVEADEGVDFEIEGETMGVHMELITDTLVVSEVGGAVREE